MMNVTMMTEVARIATQIKMMRGPPSAIVSRMVCDSAAALVSPVASCAKAPGEGRNSQQKGTRARDSDELTFFMGNQSGNNHLLLFDENVSAVLRFGNNGSIVVEKSNRA